MKQILIWVALGVLFTGSLAQGQQTTQRIMLTPGWNAVHLAVSPAPNDVASVFQGLPVEGVWAWNKRFSSVQYLRNPAELLPNDPDWLCWIPADPAKAAVSNLYVINGGWSYLIKLGGDEAVEWTLTGVPVNRPVQWNPDSFNLQGFSVDSDNPPTLSEFFSPSDAHRNQPMFRLNSQGVWERISEGSAVTLRSGEAYWLYCKGASDYQGLMQATLPASEGLLFGKDIVEFPVTLINTMSTTQSFTVNLEAATPSPASSTAGRVPLSWYNYQGNPETGAIGWEVFDGPLTWSAPAGASVYLRLAVRRPDMVLPAGTAATPPFQSLLKARGQGGQSITIPVSADVRLAGGTSAAGHRVSLAADGAALRDYGGLWVGTAVMTHVSEPLNPEDGVTPTTTSATFRYRLIMHVNGAGEAKLLQQVTQMWRPATYKPDPADPTGETQIVDTPGEAVLLTDASLISQYSGFLPRDDQMVGRRISSPAFTFKEPHFLMVAGGGGFGLPQSTLETTVTLAYDDPLNPFVHRYHPDHDNWDEKYETLLPEGMESYSVQRWLQFRFTDADPTGSDLSGWGDTRVGGLISEHIQGIHRRTIHIDGRFILNRMATVSELNPTP